MKKITGNFIWYILGLTGVLYYLITSAGSPEGPSNKDLMLYIFYIAIWIKADIKLNL